MMTTKRVQFIFLGAPGSGKGTQASLIAQAHDGMQHVSTGDLFRSEIKRGTDLGREVEATIKDGRLVDDATTLRILKANCEPSICQYIFDGYPRNRDQAQSLDDVVLEGASRRAIYFKVDTESLVRRITQRRVCRGCGSIWNLESRPPQEEGVCDKCGEILVHRSDDREEVIRERMKIYESEILPIVDYYGDDLIKIDASLPMNEVTKRLEGVMGL
jgi:adenylate kinase